MRLLMGAREGATKRVTSYILQRHALNIFHYAPSHFPSKVHLPTRDAVSSPL